MAYFRCTTGGSGKGNTLVVTCADDLAGATITCTNGTKTYTKTCPSTSPYEVTFYGLMAGTWTVSATVSGNTYTTTVVVVDCAALLGGFNWKTWVDLSQNYNSSDFTDLDDLLSDETAVRELMTIHDCVDYLAGIAAESADVETIIGNDLCAKWINLSDYALDTLSANTVIKGYMDTADKYGYGEWALVGQVPTMTSNTAPYGTAIANSALADAYAAWKAFDNSTDSQWLTISATTNNYVGYTFQSAIRPSKVKVNFYVTVQSGYTSPLRTFKVQGSNDGFASDIHDLETFSVDTKSADTEIIIDVDIASNTAYSSLRIYCTDTLHVSYQWSIGVESLQFYTWQPKGNVPVMTANNAPYGTANASSNYTGQEPYKAFDGNDSTSWVPAAGAGTNAILYWNPVVPVRATKIKYRSDNARPTSIEIQGYNSEGDYHRLALVSPSGTGDQYFDLSGDIDYYTHYCLIIRATSDDFPHVNTLQFYGRELSVSVPTMTNNTTPYGTASLESEVTGYEAYKAFDNNASTYAHTASANDQHLQYDFVNPIKLEQVYILSTEADVRTPRLGQVLGSEDGTIFEEVYDFNNAIPTRNVPLVQNVENNKVFKSVRLIFRRKSTDTYDGSLTQVQFYGKDYSEKEFETGTTKKWLYDHGLLLNGTTWDDTATYHSAYTQRGSITDYISYFRMMCTAQTYSFVGRAIANQIDFTDYALVRARNNVGGSISPGLDVSSLNGSYYLGLYSAMGGTALIGALLINSSKSYMLNNAVAYLQDSERNQICDISELWLE